MDEKFVEKRVKLLNAFLIKVAATSHIYYSEEFQLFIRGPP
jgi:hypothetical protein